MTPEKALAVANEIEQKMHDLCVSCPSVHCPCEYYHILVVELAEHLALYGDSFAVPMMGLLSIKEGDLAKNRR